LLAGVALYTGLVLIQCLTGGPHLRPRFELRDPARSAERLAVWLGVKSLALAARVVAPIFGMLSEASAEVGEWFLGLRHHETH
jgi:hypothetical protein